MKIRSVIIFFAGALLSLAFRQSLPAQTPPVFLLDARVLAARKQSARAPKSPDPALKAAVARLDAEAAKLLKTEILPITAKEATPPSGDKRDYMSQAPYFWPNPKTPDGLPYIRRDGERNPEIKRFPDHERLDRMEDAVERLALAYYFTDDERYASRAAEILRLWFLDAKTRMNPNLNFAQAIPGQNTGRGIGIIETRGLTRVIDAIGLLDGSKAWTDDDRKGLRSWFEQYLTWLTTSKNGLQEAAEKNNHGTYYDVQVAAAALFTGQTELARKVLGDAREKRIARQIETDGRQPLELARTKSWSYSVMNLQGLIALAALGESAGVDLWNFQTADGRSIRRALEFLAPYLDDRKKWPYQQIEPVKREELAALVRRAARRFTDEKFRTLAAALPPPAGDFETLLY
ncbi:MAG: alginate lyase family protein [Acidobacteria bacterium]|nr:alginate lyase family protein [Acidobacteriota bacterium]